MISKRNIVHACITIVLAIAVVGIGIGGSRRAADPVCPAITITIQDSTQRQYVTRDELQQQLQQAGLWQVGLPLSKINCQQIEQTLLSHPMLRRAQCYELANGEVRIVVSQRRPIVLIAGDDHYYLDSDRKLMPVRASVNTPVPVVTGRIGRQQAQTEMYDFVRWLSANKFWCSKIHTIHVTNPKMIELQDDSHQYTLLLGSLNGAQQRLADLQKLYEEGFERIGYPPYKQIDLMYKGQIIGRK